MYIPEREILGSKVHKTLHFSEFSSCYFRNRLIISITFAGKETWRKEVC